MHTGGTMKVLCIIEVDEDMLNTVTSEENNQYNFNDAFRLEMRWMSNSGMKLDGFVCLSEQEASDILITYM